MNRTSRTARLKTTISPAWSGELVIVGPYPHGWMGNTSIPTVIVRNSEGKELAARLSDLIITTSEDTMDLQSMNREQLISWLCQNDRNGCYTDEDAAAEGWPPLTRAEALELALDQI